MPSFYDNLRAARGDIRTLTSSFPTRKDIQKERQSIATFNNGEKADWGGLDKWAQEETSKTPKQRADESQQKGVAAAKGTKFLKRDILNDPNLFEIDPQVDFFSNLQIAQNSDKLNKIVDDYETANGWDEKQQVIKNGYESFPNKTAKLIQWFDNFARLTSRAADPNDDFNDAPEEIAGAMRYYLNSAKNKYFKKV